MNNLHCPNCGRSGSSMNQDDQGHILEITCIHCGYQWKPSERSVWVDMFPVIVIVLLIVVMIILSLLGVFDGLGGLIAPGLVLSQVLALPALVGQTIIQVREMTHAELVREHWEGYREQKPVAIILSDGKMIYASTEPAGMTPGTLIGRTKAGKGFYVSIE